jgi:hypothetical protein
MSRLPTPGSDDGTWGDVLNDFLSVEHNSDGTQKTVPLTKGGTGAIDAATARTNLGTVSASDSRLSDTRTPSDGSVTNAKVASSAAIDPTKVAGTAVVDADSRLTDARLTVKKAGTSIGTRKNLNLVEGSNMTISAAANTAGGGVVYAPQGNYKTTSSLTWYTKVSLVGDGVGRTVFKPAGNDFGFIFTNFTSGAPAEFFEMSEFEIDGSGMTTAGGTPGKGIHMKYVRNARFFDLYVHDCGMTGIGTDFCMEAGVIDRCYVKGNGRLNDGTQSSGNGIGIGSAGTTDEEPITITNCHAINNKRYGIFVETQAGTTSTRSSGARIIGNYASGSQVGIGDAGNRRTIIANNSCTNNSVAGISADFGTFSTPKPGYDGLIIGNNCYLNTGEGIKLNFAGTSVPGGRWTVQNNILQENSGRGLFVLADATDLVTIVIDGNTIHDNNFSGIRVAYGGATNTASLKYSEIINNVIFNNGASGNASDGHGIRLEIPCTDVVMSRNRCFDRLATKQQIYGFSINTTFTGGAIADNDLRNNKTGSVSVSNPNLSSSTQLRGNHGWTHPAPATTAVGASPWTYTASSVPEWLFLYGGTVTSVTVGGQQIASGSNVAIPLEPGDAAVVTYSSAPTAAVRKR